MLRAKCNSVRGTGADCGRSTDLHRTNGGGHLIYGTAYGNNHFLR